MKSLLAWLRPALVVGVILVLGSTIYLRGSSISQKLTQEDMGHHHDGPNNPQRQAMLPANVTDSRAFISALGQIQPAGGNIIRVAPSGLAGGRPRVERLFVAEGDRVAAGQVLAWLDNYSRSALAVKQAEAQLREAQGAAAQARAHAGAPADEAEAAGVARLRAESENARAEAERSETLFRSGFLSATAVEAARTRAHAAAEELRRAEANTRTSGVVRRADLASAQARVSEAEVTLDRQKVDLELSLVRAPAAGTILKIQTHEGEEAGARGILEMGNTDTMYAVARVFEGDIHYVQIGDLAYIASPSLPQTVAGRVESIGVLIGRNDLVDLQPASPTDYRVVPVQIRLDSNPVAAKLSGLLVDIYIEK